MAMSENNADWFKLVFEDRCTDKVALIGRVDDETFSSRVIPSQITIGAEVADY
jgi:hypothetical protein